VTFPVIDDLFYPDGRPILEGPECRYCGSTDLECKERAEREDGFELASYICRKCNRKTTYCDPGGSP